MRASRAGRVFKPTPPRSARLVRVPPVLSCSSPRPFSLPLAGEPQIPLYQAATAAGLATVSRSRLAEQITGGLSITSKMPCPSFSISAFRCRLGSVLAETGGMTCHDCYDRKGRKSFGKVRAKLEERYAL